MADQVWIQILAIAVTVAWCGVGSLILFKIVDLIVGLRPSIDIAREGLDLTSPGEVAYHN